MMTTKWPDETLMAFADGELDEPMRAELERALGADPALRQRVEAMGAQRDRLAAAFAPVLDEPMPERLATLLRPPALPPSVADLGAARERRRRMPSWAQWGGIAASVLLGVLLGTQFDRLAASPELALRDGRLVAEGAVRDALASQLASAPVAGAPVAVQLSFVDKTGAYCRTFSTAAVAGLACRRQDQWAVQTLVAAEAAPEGGVRQAASALPRAVLDAVDQRIAGDALDAGRERQARDQGWRR
jgi:hypothetical protein